MWLLPSWLRSAVPRLGYACRWIMHEMSAIDRLLASPPFGLDDRQKAPLFLAAMREAFVHHLAACEPFRRIALSQGFRSAADLDDLARAPFLPAALFKRFDLVSVPPSEIRSVLHSSATSGDPSKIAIDTVTATRQAVVSARTIAEFIGHERRPFLVADEEPAAERTRTIPARLAAARGFTAFATSIDYLLRRPAEGAIPDFDFMVSSLEARERAGAPVTVFGLTFALHHDVVLPLLSRGLAFHLPAGSSVAHIGGWKRLEQARVDRVRFVGDVCSVLGVAPERVFDFYGFTEQMGLVYGGAGLEPKVVPAYAEVLVRDPRTLAPAPDGAPGLLQVLTPLPHSHPGVSVLTDDIARIVSRGSSDSGRCGTRFELLGRVEGAEPRGCSDLAPPDGH